MMTQLLSAPRNGSFLARRTKQRPGSKSFLRRSRAVILGTSSVVLVLIGWQLAVQLRLVNTAYVPAPTRVAVALVELLGLQDFWVSLGVTLVEFVLGLVISIVLGGLLGILCGWYGPVDEFFKPLVIATNALPHVAIVPIVIMLFGIGIEPKIVIVVLACTVTMLMNTAAGVENVERQLMMMSRSLGATDLQAIKTVVMPSVVPYFMTGVRISVGRALVAVIVAEFFASQNGLGNMLIKAGNSFNMPVMFALVVIMMFLGLLLTQGAQWLENRLQRWNA